MAVNMLLCGTTVPEDAGLRGEEGQQMPLALNQCWNPPGDMLDDDVSDTPHVCACELVATLTPRGDMAAAAAAPSSPGCWLDGLAEEEEEEGGGGSGGGGAGGGAVQASTCCQDEQLAVWSGAHLSLIHI